jgi:hypothetical protein
LVGGLDRQAAPGIARSDAPASRRATSTPNRNPPTLGVLAPVAVEQSHLQPVVDVLDTLRASRVGHGGVPLGEAAHGPAERRDAVGDLDGDLGWMRDVRVAGDLGARVVFDLAAGGVHARDATARPARR